MLHLRISPNLVKTSFSIVLSKRVELMNLGSGKLGYQTLRHLLPRKTNYYSHSLILPLTTIIMINDIQHRNGFPSQIPSISLRLGFPRASFSQLQRGTSGNALVVLEMHTT